MIGRYIDLGNNPVADHPINRGLVAWWHALPNNFGGLRIHDIKGGNHGVFQGSPIMTWAPHHSGAFAGICGNGSNAFAQTALKVQDVGAHTAGTMSFWFRNAGAPDDGTRQIMWCQTETDSDGAPSISFQKFTDNNLYAGWFIGTEMRVVVADDSNNYAANAWTHYTLVWEVDTNSVLYVNGGRNAYTAGNTQTTSASPARTFRMGISDGGTPSGAILDGSAIASVALWKRRLTSSEAYLVYEESLKDYPNTLRRFSRKAYLFVRLPLLTQGYVVGKRI